MLLLLAKHPGRVYTRAQLLDLIWGLGYEGYEHTVNSHINRLRAKIEQRPAQPRFFADRVGCRLQVCRARPVGRCCLMPPLLRTLHGRLAAILLGLLCMVACIAVPLWLSAAQRYRQEVDQNVNRLAGVVLSRPS